MRVCYGRDGDFKAICCRRFDTKKSHTRIGQLLNISSDFILFYILQLIRRMNCVNNRRKERDEEIRFDRSRTEPIWNIFDQKFVNPTS